MAEIDWKTPGAAQMQMNALRTTDPAQAAILDRYLQGRDDAQNTPMWRMPIAAGVGTGLAAGYEAVKALPQVGKYDPLDAVAYAFGPQFKRGTPGTPDATSPASLSNVVAIGKGYRDVALERVNDTVNSGIDAVKNYFSPARQAQALEQRPQPQPSIYR